VLSRRQFFERVGIGAVVLPIGGTLFAACQTGAAAPSKPAAAAPQAVTTQTGGSSAATPPTAQPTPVKVATAGALTDAGLFIAMDRGYFREQALEVEFTALPSASQTIPLVSTNQIQVAGGSIGVGFFNALQRDAGIKVVADKGLAAPGWPALLFLVRPELQVETIGDLRGRKIGLTARGLAQEINLQRLASKHGVSLSEFEFVEMPFPETLAGLANKAIDATIVVEPFAALAKQQGVARVWLGSDEISPGQQSAMLLYSEEFATNQADAARRFMIAYLKGVRAYKKAFNAASPEEREAIAQILVDNSNIKNVGLFNIMAMPYLDGDGYVNLDSLRADQEILVALGYLNRVVPPTQFTDHSFVEYALQQLGRYDGQ
jgi:NitT/TauT family transport system substrate-binding protein